MLVLGRRSYVRSRPYPRRKTVAVEELADLLRKYSYVFLFDLHGLSSRILHEYRYRLRKVAVIKVAKPTLFRIAYVKVFGEMPMELLERVRGEVGFIFTNMNPSEFLRVVAANAVRRAAQPGDKAPFDIVVPAGPTNAPPGPIISKFGKLKIPTRVQEGKIWIAKDSVVAKAGQDITPEVAEVLRVVGIEPIYEQLRLLGIIWKGKRYVAVEEVAVDPRRYQEWLKTAAIHARNLAINLVYPTPEVLHVVLPMAHMRAVALAARLGVVTRETITHLLTRAIAEARALAAVVGLPELGPSASQASQAAPSLHEAKAEEGGGNRHEGPSEEEIASSLGSLF